MGEVLLIKRAIFGITLSCFDNDVLGMLHIMYMFQRREIIYNNYGLENVRAVKVRCVIGVVHAARFDEKVVAVVVVGEEVNRGLRHFHDGGLDGFFTLGETVVVVAEVARSKEAEYLAIPTGHEGKVLSWRLKGNIEGGNILILR